MIPKAHLFIGNSNVKSDRAQNKIKSNLKLALNNSMRLVRTVTLATTSKFTDLRVAKEVPAVEMIFGTNFRITLEGMIGPRLLTTIMTFCWLKELKMITILQR